MREPTAPARCPFFGSINCALVREPAYRACVISSIATRLPGADSVRYYLDHSMPDVDAPPPVTPSAAIQVLAVSMVGGAIRRARAAERRSASASKHQRHRAAQHRATWR